MIKKNLFILFVTALIFTGISIVPALATQHTKVYLNSHELRFDVPPQEVNNRLLVPLRSIFEALGATVDYKEDTRTILAVKDDARVVLNIGSKEADISGKQTLLDVPPKEIAGRVLVPLRFVSEALGANVDYVKATNTVNITSNTPTLDRREVGEALHSDRHGGGREERIDTIVTPAFNENELIFGDPLKSGFASAEEAQQYMTTINIKTWNLLSSGEKTTRTMSITVNKNFADTVKNIFEEIYNGKEKFPIKDLGGYVYRNGTSQHSFGIAIDINANENCFIGKDGTIKAGQFWSPGTNPYSITRDGDVVKAFNNAGWSWSPDMGWSNGADYMHFSLMGT